MRLPHIAIAILIAFIWGFNFIVVQTGLADVSSMVLCSARFFLASVPFVFFIKKPKIPFTMLAAYGLLNFFLQYTLLFGGMMLGMPAGLASLLYQTQIFFSLILAALFFKEKISAVQLCGLIAALFGIFIVAFNKGSDFSALGFVMVLGAAISWSAGNIVVKKIGKVNMFALVVWGNFVSWPPVFALTYLVEGKEEIISSVKNMSDLSVLAVMYIVYLSTLVSFSLWCFLLSRYPVSVVVPFTLLVPIVGMFSSAIVFGEPLYSWKLTAGAFIILGICINIFGPTLLRKITHRKLSN